MQEEPCNAALFFFFYVHRIRHTVVSHALERLFEERPPVPVQGPQPRRLVIRLEVVCVNVCVLLLHGGESGDANIRQVLPVIARGLGDGC